MDSVLSKSLAKSVEYLEKLDPTSLKFYMMTTLVIRTCLYGTRMHDHVMRQSQSKNNGKSKNKQVSGGIHVNKL